MCPGKKKWMFLKLFCLTRLQPGELKKQENLLKKKKEQKGENKAADFEPYFKNRFQDFRKKCVFSFFFLIFATVF